MIRSICLFICVATSAIWRPATAQEYLGQWYGTSEAAGDLYALFAPDTLDLWFFDADSLCYELSQWSYTPGIPNFSLTSIDGEEGAGSLTYEVAIVYVT